MLDIKTTQQIKEGGYDWENQHEEWVKVKNIQDWLKKEKEKTTNISNHNYAYSLLIKFRKMKREE